MIRKVSAAVALVILLVSGAHADALKPATLFTNQSTVEAGTPVDLNAQPDEVTWTMATFGGFTTFEVTLDASIDYPCSTATYYPVSTMDGSTAVLSRGVDLTGERCVRANLRSHSGDGGITSIKLNMRGL